MRKARCGNDQKIKKHQKRWQKIKKYHKKSKKDQKDDKSSQPLAEVVQTFKTHCSISFLIT